MFDGSGKVSSLEIAFLVQHCQSHHHVDPQARLWPDFRNGLTEFGQRQAQCLAKRLCDEACGRPCCLYTSPMKRATETAEIIGVSLGTTPQTVSGLHEYNGRFPLERAEDGKEWTVDNSNWSLFDWRPFPEAETWREFYARVAAAMDTLAQQSGDGEPPIFVIHGGTLSNIVVWWLGLPLDVLPERTCFSASPGSLSILKKNRCGNPIIERLNDRAHLGALCENQTTPNKRMWRTDDR